MGTLNARSEIVLVVKKQEMHHHKLHCIPGLGPSAVDEGARGPRWTLARKNVSCTH